MITVILRLYRQQKQNEWRKKKKPACPLQHGTTLRRLRIWAKTADRLYNSYSCNEERSRPLSVHFYMLFPCHISHFLLTSGHHHSGNPRMSLSEVVQLPPSYSLPRIGCRWLLLGTNYYSSCIHNNSVLYYPSTVTCCGSLETLVMYCKACERTSDSYGGRISLRTI